MKILLVEPCFTGSHAAWAEGYARHNQHQIDILSLPGRFWKWRMHGGAVTSCQDFLGASVVEALYCDAFPLLPKRLAYPYLMPPEEYPHCFYDDFEDLLARLTEAITNLEQPRRFSRRPVVARYDWQNQAKQYDQFFLELMES